MPHMDGLEAAQRIRQLEAQAAGGKLRREAGEPAAQQGSADLERSLRHSSCSHSSAHRRIPIWAVSACSESEQLCSPALAHLSAESHAGQASSSRHMRPHCSNATCWAARTFPAEMHAGQALSSSHMHPHRSTAANRAYDSGFRV